MYKKDSFVSRPNYKRNEKSSEHVFVNLLDSNRFNIVFFKSLNEALQQKHVYPLYNFCFIKRTRRKSLERKHTIYMYTHNAISVLSKEHDESLLKENILYI
mgnify:CR=1 FL=1